MNEPAQMPENVRIILIYGFISREADVSIRDGARRGNFPHAGDPLGQVIAWLWRTDPDEAMVRLGDYLGELRIHHDKAPTPPITLDDVLGALRSAMPNDFSRAEFEALCARARVDVPKYYGGPVN